MLAAAPHRYVPSHLDVPHNAGDTMPDASTTSTYQIAAIPADGVGVEVIAAGRAVLDAVAAGSNGAFGFEWTEFPWGCGYYEKTGRTIALRPARPPGGAVPRMAGDLRGY